MKHGPNTAFNVYRFNVEFSVIPFQRYEQFFLKGGNCKNPQDCAIFVYA